jgi:hypothetical protein
MFCKRCPGLLCSESGEPDKISPAFCQQAEELYRLYQQKKAEAEAETATDPANQGTES